MLIGGGGGGGGSVSAATPETLHRAGLAFQRGSNVCGDIARGRDLQAGGQLEIDVVNIMPRTGGVPSDFSSAVQSVVQGFLGAMISANQQLADAALDLMQCAGDFTTADSGLPPGVYELPGGTGFGNGITAYTGPGGQVFYKDRDGDIIHAMSGPAAMATGGTPYHQTYAPPPSSGSSSGSPSSSSSASPRAS